MTGVIVIGEGVFVRHYCLSVARLGLLAPDVLKIVLALTASLVKVLPTRHLILIY